MATQTPAPYQPTSDDDARIHLAQIIGSDPDPDIDVWTGDWRKALTTFSTRNPLPANPATDLAA